MFREIREKYPNDWLLSVELYELAKNNSDDGFAQAIRTHLETVKLNNPNVGHLIDDGLALVDGHLVS